MTRNNALLRQTKHCPRLREDTVSLRNLDSHPEIVSSQLSCPVDSGNGGGGDSTMMLMNMLAMTMLHVLKEEAMVLMTVHVFESYSCGDADNAGGDTFFAESLAENIPEH